MGGLGRWGTSLPAKPEVATNIRTHAATLRWYHWGWYYCRFIVTNNNSKVLFGDSHAQVGEHYVDTTGDNFLGVVNNCFLGAYRDDSSFIANINNSPSFIVTINISWIWFGDCDL